MMRIKPRTGLTVRDPRTMKPLPDGGRDVTMSAYWRRRLAAGDVVPVTATGGKTSTKARVAQAVSEEA